MKRYLFNVCYESQRKGSWGITFGIQVWATDEEDAKRIVKQRAPDAVIWGVEKIPT